MPALDPVSSFSFVLLASVLSLSACVGRHSQGGSGPDTEGATLQTPPVAEQRAHVHVEHGVEREDPYYWLREKEDPDVIAYVEAENAYLRDATAHLEDERKALFDEMLARIQENDESVPYLHGGWQYYSRTEEGKPYRIYCRKGADGVEQVLVDVNALAEGHEYMALGHFKMSPDHNLIAYGTDTDGSEIYTLRFRDARTGETLSDEVKGAYYSLAWGNDNKTVFYTKLDEAHRPWQVWRHEIGTDQAEDALVFQEDDDRYFVGVGKTRSEQFLLISLGSAITSEYLVLDADNPTGDFRVFSPRHQGMEYSLTHHGDRFYVVTNDSDDTDGKHDKRAINFKLMSAPLDATDRSQWAEVIGHREEVLIKDVDAFTDHLVIHEREGGFPQLRVRQLSTGEEHVVSMPEPVYTLSGSSNPEFDTSTFRFGYGSLVTPNSVFDYDLNTRERTLMKESPVLGGYDRTLYASERVVAIADDGTEVPISIVYKKDIDKEGPRALWLTGYGSYGMSYDPSFSSTRLSLLDRGVSFAIAHIRGGGEMGRRWKEDGKFLNKTNTFTDFIDCAEHLVDAGYTASDRLVIQGGSAGGLLMGAVLNMRPDLFLAAIARVPFVDVVTTMLDESIPLTAIEWEEWGNPKDKTYFDYMLAYSPYDNVKAQDYPHLLVTSGLNDPRVQYWEPTKWVARLRTQATGSGQILLKTDMGAGHGGKSGRYGRLEEQAFLFAFALDKLGLVE